MRTLTKEMQEKLTPQQALTLLKEGNKRFINNLKINRNLLQQVNETSEGQYPFAFILSCIDSRTSAELIFDQGLGDIFSCRIAGNILNSDIVGSMEFACKISGSKIIVVLGHTKCGAIKGACANAEIGNLTGLLTKIKPAIEAEAAAIKDRTSVSPAFVENVTYHNIRLTLKRIPEQSPILAKMIQDGQIILVGAIYNVETGTVNFFEDEMITSESYQGQHLVGNILT
jgi:carbonic anhydrase